MNEHRYTLRHLPLAAKLVLSAFLIAVGLGYFSAIVQLHLQHSERNGEVLPTPSRTIEIFAGVKKFDPNAPKPVSKLEKLVMGPIEGAPWNGSGSMAAAFFKRDNGDYNSTIKDDPAAKPKLDAEREGDRHAVQAWINLPDDERKNTYAADKMPRPAAVTAMTKEFLDGDQVKVHSILADRCARCHAKGEEQEKFPLETYEHILKYLDAPKADAPSPGGWVPSTCQIGIDKLTQTTHAHLLSFAMLFGLTGFAFAFTSYPRSVRFLFAPLVLVAQVLDISCWWLARIPEVGPYFALAILGTGTAVGLGLVVQIVATLFDMYGRKGRFVLILLFTAAAAGFGALYVKVIEPALAAEKAKP